MRNWFVRDSGRWATLAVAGVWMTHGLYNKLLHGSPRHLAIVQAIPGLSGAAGERVLAAVGVAEVGIAVWVLSHWLPHLCAAVQTCVLLSMNVVELAYARELLLWPAGLIPVNAGFLAVAWFAAGARTDGWRTRLRRHPVSIEATLRDCVTLTYALPAGVLRPLLPPGLELEVVRDCGFVAVALVRAESLRPAALPAACGQDFFLAGYRVFTKAHVGGRTLRGLRILRSDADRWAMVTGGNLLTHYNYRRCDATMRTHDGELHISVRAHHGSIDLDVRVKREAETLPPGSPFTSVREARRFAGPLPFTFDYEPETHSIVAIRATRAGWQPRLVDVDVNRINFFDAPPFAGCAPVLAAAFRVEDVAYRWERGVVYPLERAV